jgi:hypothetical protein
MSVWDRLAYRDPRIAAQAEAIWIARKDGRIRRLVERTPRYKVLQDNAAIGPQSGDEWNLLAEACLEAIEVVRLSPRLQNDQHHRSHED